MVIMSTLESIRLDKAIRCSSKYIVRLSKEKPLIFTWSRVGLSQVCNSQFIPLSPLSAYGLNELLSYKWFNCTFMRIIHPWKKWHLTVKVKIVACIFIIVTLQQNIPFLYLVHSRRWVYKNCNPLPMTSMIVNEFWLFPIFLDFIFYQQ